MRIYVCLNKDYSENAAIRDLRYWDSVSMTGLPIHISLMEPVFCNGCSWFALGEWSGFAAVIFVLVNQGRVC